MKREKDLILATINTTSSSNNSNNHRYSYGSNDNKAGGYPSKRFEEHTSLVDVNLKFNFDIWVSTLTTSFIFCCVFSQFLNVIRSNS